VKFAMRNLGKLKIGYLVFIVPLNPNISARGV